MSAPKAPSIISVNYDELRFLPMLVGAISPVSIIMSLPPLTGNWVIDGVERKSLKSLPLVITLSFAVAFLLIANLCLLFRFMERRIVLNTFLSIYGYLLHACLMFFPLIHFYIKKLGSNEKLSGDFYVGVCVSVISLVSALFLVIDYFRHNRLRLKGSGISNKQRNLVFFCILVTLWSSFGALIFSFIEGWSFTRGVYFTLVTMTTIGFGDYVPKETSTRIFLFPYSIVGIVAMGILINSIRIVIIEKFESIYLEKLDELGIADLERYFTLSKKATAVGIPTALGAVIFMGVEGWSYFEALYFCFVSFTTVGYGDNTLKTFSGIVVFIGYALLGLVAAAYVISVATELWSVTLEKQADKIEKKHRVKAGEAIGGSMELTSQLLLSELETFDQNSGNCELDFLCQLVGVVRLYHSQVGYHLNDCEATLPSDIFDSPRFKKIERYHLIVSKLLERSQGLIKAQLNNGRASPSNPELVSIPDEVYHPGSMSEQIELLQRHSGFP
ncbi:Potassium channel [Massospora cicadina]|nr:Potassium channel [Massospora cicadina]